MEAPDSGCRYQRAVRQSMNKMMSNRSSVHHVLAGIITEYSHKSWVRPGSNVFGNKKTLHGSYMLGSRFHFFVVKRLFSPHWCEGYFCPPRVGFTNTSTGLAQYYMPDIFRRSSVRRKRIFDPWALPTVRVRTRTFTLESKHEPLSNIPFIFG